MQQRIGKTGLNRLLMLVISQRRRCANVPYAVPLYGMGRARVLNVRTIHACFRVENDFGFWPIYMRRFFILSP